MNYKDEKFSKSQNSLRKSNKIEFNQNSLRSHNDVDSDDQNPQPKHISRKMLYGIIIGTIVALLLVLGIYMYSAMYVKVPSLSGMMEEEAAETLKKMGLKAEIKYKSVKEAVNPKVISQNMEADKRIKKESTVVITIEKEAEYLVIDNYSNKKYELVKADLDKLNIKTSETRSFDDSIKKGRIIKQDVKKGTKVYEGEIINFTISKGHEKTKVPDVEGKSESVARETLKKAKLEINLNYEYSNNVSTGDVIRQGIDSGKSVNTNTVVTITISKGPKPKSEPLKPKKYIIEVEEKH